MTTRIFLLLLVCELAQAVVIRQSAVGSPQRYPSDAIDAIPMTAESIPSEGDRDVGDAGSRDQPSGQEWVSAKVDGFAGELEVELYGSTRATAPGGLVVVRYAVTSYQDQDERVTLQLRLPHAWLPLDEEMQGQELFIEAWDIVEGEIRVGVPIDALPGERHWIQVVGEIPGESGSMQVFSYVHVLRKGGLRPGDVGMTGTASMLATSFAVDDPAGARYGGTVDLSSKLSSSTTLALNYRQGPRENTVTNFRIAQEETRWSGTLRREHWTATLGNQISSMGNVLTGPSVRARGVNIRRTKGRVTGDIVVAEPTSYFSDPAGHVVRGTASLVGRRGRLAATLSDFTRPGGGYSTAPKYSETIDPEELERLERERKAMARASRNRVLGGGLDSELTFESVHRFNLRTGWMRISNAAGDMVAGPSAELQYGLHHTRGTISLRWRNMPRSLPGIYLPGDEASVDASVRVIGNWHVTGRTYRTTNHTKGSGYHSEGKGASMGLRYTKNTWRMDVRGNWRSWDYGQWPTEARTINVAFGMPVGPVTMSAYAEKGHQQQDGKRQPAATCHLGLRWSGNRGSTASLSASYFESLHALPRLRTDVLASMKFGEWEVVGGAWATRGLLTGSDPGVWMQIGIPISFDLSVSLGLEYAPPTWGELPAWLGTFGVRKKLAFPIPFIRRAPPVA